jgi:hypothetical protein
MAAQQPEGAQPCWRLTSSQDDSAACVLAVADCYGCMMCAMPVAMAAAPLMTALAAALARLCL